MHHCFPLYRSSLRRGLWMGWGVCWGTWLLFLPVTWPTCKLMHHCFPLYRSSLRRGLWVGVGCPLKWGAWWNRCGRRLWVTWLKSCPVTWPVSQWNRWVQCALLLVDMLKTWHEKYSVLKVRQNKSKLNFLFCRQHFVYPKWYAKHLQQICRLQHNSPPAGLTGLQYLKPPFHRISGYKWQVLVNCFCKYSQLAMTHCW